MIEVTPCFCHCDCSDDLAENEHTKSQREPETVERGQELRFHTLEGLRSISLHHFLHIKFERLKHCIPHETLQKGKTMGNIVGFSILTKEKGRYSSDSRIVQSCDLVFEKVKDRECRQEERKAPKGTALGDQE